MPNNSNVDQRIIEMRIDNDKFEAGAKKTLDILDKLDKSLNGIGKINSDGFDNVSKTMDVINDKFSISRYRWSCGPPSGWAVPARRSIHRT